jgi:uncharacterized protein (DUF1697 family)
MTRRAALLGSINVGGHRLEMTELKAALEADGFANVNTVAASGNVLFDHPCAGDAKLEQRIASAVQTRFGIPTFAAVRTRAQLQAALAENPFAGEGEDKMVHVHFLERQPTPDAFATLLAHHAGSGPERLAPGTRCLHIDYVSGVGTSKLTGDLIARRLGCRGTARNIRSLRRIIETMDL